MSCSVLLMSNVLFCSVAHLVNTVVPIWCVAGMFYPPLACMGVNGQPTVHSDFYRHMESVCDIMLEVVDGLM